MAGSVHMAEVKKLVRQRENMKQGLPRSKFQVKKPVDGVDIPKVALWMKNPDRVGRERG